MKIVIAPDSFKESLSADKCCQAIKAGFSTVFPDARYVCLPIADGGEGTVDAMVAATGGKRVSVDVSGPIGEKVNGFYGLTGDGKTAIIEMAAASGLMLVAPEARNPLLASVSAPAGDSSRHGRGDSPYYSGYRRQRHGGWRNGSSAGARCAFSGRAGNAAWRRRGQFIAPGEH